MGRHCGATACLLPHRRSIHYWPHVVMLVGCFAMPALLGGGGKKGGKQGGGAAKEAASNGHAASATKTE